MLLSLAIALTLGTVVLAISLWSPCPSVLPLILDNCCQPSLRPPSVDNLWGGQAEGDKEAQTWSLYPGPCLPSSQLFGSSSFKLLTPSAGMEEYFKDLGLSSKSSTCMRLLNMTSAR